LVDINSHEPQQNQLRTYPTHQRPTSCQYLPNDWLENTLVTPLAKRGDNIHKDLVKEYFLCSPWP